MNDPFSYPVSVMSYRNRRAADWISSERAAARELWGAAAYDASIRLIWLARISHAWAASMRRIFCRLSQSGSASVSFCSAFARHSADVSIFPPNFLRIVGFP